MKRKVLLITLASLASIMSITGCKKSQKDPNKIYVSVVSLGYKYQWLNDLMSAYSNKTGTKFSLQVQYGQDGNNKLNNEIKALNGQSDIYAIRPGSFFELLYRHKITTPSGEKYDYAFEPMTDIFRSEYEGETGNNTIEKKLDADLKDYLYFDNDYFALPWSGGFVSFARNLDAWEACGFTADQYPRTTEEMFEMMDQMNTVIASASSSSYLKERETMPMIYCEDDEYYSTILGSWFAQYEGDEMMQNFYNGRDSDGLRSTKMFSYDGIGEALSVLKRMLEYDKNSKKFKYQSVDSLKTSFTQMQNYFLLGRGVLCVNGTWLETENPETSNYRIDYIKIPMVSSIVDKLSKTYTEEELRELISFIDAHPNVGDNEGLSSDYVIEDVEIVRDSRNKGSIMRTDYDHLFVIPAWSSKKAQAKEFLKWIYSDEGLQIFFNTMKGHHLPALPSTGSYDTSKVHFSTFRESCNKFLNERYFCTYLINTEKDKMFSIAGINRTFGNKVKTEGGNICTWLREGTSVSEIIQWNTTYLEKNWATIMNKVGQDD